IGDETHIVVTATQQEALREAFRAELGRNPTAEELRTRLDRWIEEQVLYREALALNLDSKDAIVHRQLTQKMRFLLDDGAVIPTPDDAQLQSWLDQHMPRYGKPAIVSFEQVFLSRGQRGEQLQSDAALISKELAAQPDKYLELGDPFPLGQEIKNLNAVELRREFGAGFMQALQTQPQSQWSAPIASGFGLHLIRITSRSDFQPVKLSDVRQKVLNDYLADEHARSIQQAIDQLKKKYRIEYEALSK
ncbi:MAG: peptidylprolyl isomerase, partial [Pseudomonadota bacterium]